MCEGEEVMRKDFQVSGLSRWGNGHKHCPSRWVIREERGNFVKGTFRSRHAQCGSVQVELFRWADFTGLEFRTVSQPGKFRWQRGGPSTHGW